MGYWQEGSPSIVISLTTGSDVMGWYYKIRGFNFLTTLVCIHVCVSVHVYYIFFLSPPFFGLPFGGGYISPPPLYLASVFCEEIKYLLIVWYFEYKKRNAGHSYNPNSFIQPPTTHILGLELDKRDGLYPSKLLILLCEIEVKSP